MKLESKVGKVENSDERIYSFLTDFNNIKQLIPDDKVKDWESGEDYCKFSVDPVGEAGVKLIEKEPYKLIKLKSLKEEKYDFTFWIQIKQVEENDSRIKLTMDVYLNPMLQMMAKKPLQNFLDQLVDQLGKFNY